MRTPDVHVGLDDAAQLIKHGFHYVVDRTASIELELKIMLGPFLKGSGSASNLVACACAASLLGCLQMRCLYNWLPVLALAVIQAAQTQATNASTGNQVGRQRKHRQPVI